MVAITGRKISNNYLSQNEDFMAAKATIGDLDLQAIVVCDSSGSIVDSFSGGALSQTATATGSMGSTDAHVRTAQKVSGTVGFYLGAGGGYSDFVFEWSADGAVWSPLNVADQAGQRWTSTFTFNADGNNYNFVSYVPTPGYVQIRCSSFNSGAGDTAHQGAIYVYGSTDGSLLGANALASVLGSYASVLDSISTNIASLLSLASDCSAGTQGTSNVGSAGASTLAAADGSRLACTLYNTSSSVTVYVGFGTTPTPTLHTIALSPQQFFYVPDRMCRLAINGITASGNAVVNTWKGT